MKRSAVVVALALSTVAASAHADDKAECLDAYEKAQRVRQEGKLRESKKQLGICARDSCPASIRKDCGRWLDEVDQSIPTIVLRATGANGEDLADVSVTMDGETIATSLTGAALAIDPGPHKFVFTPAGRPPVTLDAVVAEGDKRRVVTMQLDASAATTSPPGPSQPPFDREQPGVVISERPVPVLTWVLGGVGLVSLGGFGFFALRGGSTRSDLDSCRPFCSQDDIDASKQNYVIGDVFLGVSIAALAGAVILYVTRPEKTVHAASGGASR
jgi:hypothetical protein